MLRTVSSMWPLATAKSSQPSRLASRKAQPNPRLFRSQAHAGLWCDIFVAFAASPVEADHLVVEVRDSHAGCAGIFEIGNVHAHTRASLALAAEGESSFYRGVFERAVALIAIELVGLGVVGDEQIRPAVVILIEKRNPQRFGAAVENSTYGRHVLEGSIAAVVKQPAGLAAIGLGRAIRFVLAVEA